MFLRNKCYMVIDEQTDMGGGQTIAIMRILKNRNRAFPWAHLHFVRDVDFHKLFLPVPFGRPIDLGSKQ